MLTAGIKQEAQHIFALRSPSWVRDYLFGPHVSSIGHGRCLTVSVHYYTLVKFVPKSYGKGISFHGTTKNHHRRWWFLRDLRCNRTAPARLESGCIRSRADSASAGGND